MSNNPEHDSASSGSEAEGGVVDAKTLANRKKKEKKKAAAAKAKAAASAPAVAPEAASAEAADAPAAKSKAKAKPLSAAARLAQERLEAVRRLEEERKRQEEEAERQAEEEERQYQEKLRLEEEEKERKRQAKLAKKERLRAEGKLLTKAERERKLKGEILRKQMEEAGLVPRKEDLHAEDETHLPAEAETKKIVYETKKKKTKATAAATTAEQDDHEHVNQPDTAVKAGANWEDLLSSSEDEESRPPRESPKLPTKTPSSPTMSPRRAAAAAAAALAAEETSPWNIESRFRCPISAVLGHVDAGKTSLMDKIRNTSVQHGEAGGITQQIGATFIPRTNLEQSIDKVQRKSLDVEIPGLLVIDTPGHESFHNLRDRGSSVCDIAVLVVDILSGLEPQTVESLELLRKRKVPFVVAMNKVDRLYSWKAVKDRSIREALKSQKDSVVSEFKDRWAKIHLQFAEKGINVALYWENKDVKHDVSVIPTSAITGEGIPDLLFCLTKLNQQLLAPRITWKEELQCSVLEVKAIEGLGTTIDAVLVNGKLHEGDKIVVAGLHGPIVTTIRALLTPKPLKEMRVKGEFVHHKAIKGAIGVKIAAVGLEDALAGTRLVVAPVDASEEDLEKLKNEVKGEVEGVMSKVGSSDLTKEGGVYVAASTLGSLEALLSFLTDMKVPVSQVSIGELHRSHIRKASLMLEKKKEYAVILAFDVKVSAEAKKEADELGVKIFSADIIYHLFDMFTKYMDGIRKSQREAASGQAVFPCRMKIIPQYIFNKKDPIILGVDVVEGVLKIGTPIVAHAPGKALVEVGKVVGIEKDHKAVDKALNGDSVAVKIGANGGDSANTTFGRHFDQTYELVSQISRPSIETLKAHFKEEMRREDWLLVIKLKSVFDIQ